MLHTWMVIVIVFDGSKDCAMDDGVTVCADNLNYGKIRYVVDATSLLHFP